MWSLLVPSLLFVLARQSVGGSEIETTVAGEPRVGEHYRPSGGADDVPSSRTGSAPGGAAGSAPSEDAGGATGPAPGVHRVVGTGEAVTLLRVVDADGREVHAGELRQVDPEWLREGFEPATDPDAGFSPVAGLRSLRSGAYWSPDSAGAWSGACRRVRRAGDADESGGSETPTSPAGRRRRRVRQVGDVDECAVARRGAAR